MADHLKLAAVAPSLAVNCEDAWLVIIHVRPIMSVNARSCDDNASKTEKVQASVGINLSDESLMLDDTVDVRKRPIGCLVLRSGLWSIRRRVVARVARSADRIRPCDQVDRRMGDSRLRNRHQRLACLGP